MYRAIIGAIPSRLVLTFWLHFSLHAPKSRNVTSIFGKWEAVKCCTEIMHRYFFVGYFGDTYVELISVEALLRFAELAQPGSLGRWPYWCGLNIHYIYFLVQVTWKYSIWLVSWYSGWLFSSFFTTLITVRWFLMSLFTSTVIENGPLLFLLFLVLAEHCLYLLSIFRSWVKIEEVVLSCRVLNRFLFAFLSSIARTLFLLFLLWSAVISERFEKIAVLIDGIWEIRHIIWKRLWGVLFERIGSKGRRLILRRICLCHVCGVCENTWGYRSLLWWVSKYVCTRTVLAH